MFIDDKHIPTIKTSLEYSIKNIRDYHSKIQSEYLAQGRTWTYDFEKESIQPIRDALYALSK